MRIKLCWWALKPAWGYVMPATLVPRRVKCILPRRAGLKTGEPSAVSPPFLLP
nr:hypothetical protein [Photorhabdus stackebrandtii]